MSRLGKLVRTIIRQSTDTRVPVDGPAGTVHHPEPFAPRSATEGSDRRDDEPTDAAGVSYSPELDGEPDPGEVVWAWVPYEDDPAQGKDRPVLVIGRDGDRLLALQLTSQDHDLDAEDEARWGRYWMDIGAGDWDHERRPSEVRLDRLLRLDEQAVRREGAVLHRGVFDEVVRQARTHQHDL